jgi:hypothetical protein
MLCFQKMLQINVKMHATLLLAFSLCAHAFQLTNTLLMRQVFRAAKPSGGAVDLFKSEKWPAIKAVLDKVCKVS